MKFDIQDTFNKELPADPIMENARRQVNGACYSHVQPREPSEPILLHVSQEMAESLGLTQTDLESQEFLNVVSGKKVLSGTEPYAMCYGGHQFGSWAGQLGDGRAINLAEVVHDDSRWALQLKGAGETPYSRTADGLAVLRSSIREHLCSEAMHHLGVPTTRSLSLCLTGDEVLRDVMYDGHPEMELGAVVCRVASSFVRFGNFQIFTARSDKANLQKLVDYTIKHFFPEINGDGKHGYLEFFRAVADKTLRMIVEWQRVGFVHGVMNTDNMSILGLTIDYGPYGWLEGFDPGWTPNTTDRQNKRYRYGNQPAIAHWNLYQLANALYPLIEDAPPLEEILKEFQSKFVVAKIEMMSSKLGLVSKSRADVALISELEQVLTKTETDMTIFYRLLGKVERSQSIQEMQEIVMPAYYQEDAIRGAIQAEWQEWFTKYRNRLTQEKIEDTYRHKIMAQVNPKYVLRNYMAQLVIDAAEGGDYTLIGELYELLKQPYDEQPENEKWFAKRPEWARNKVGCSMLSCSS